MKFIILLREIFIYIGIYTTIATIWREIERAKYEKTIPRNRDTVIALVGAYVIKHLLFG